MKRYVVFSVSFIIIFAVFQALSGYLVTFSNTPDVTSAWNQAGSLSSSVIIRDSSFLIPLTLAFFAASIAYFLPKVFMMGNNK